MTRRRNAPGPTPGASKARAAATIRKTVSPYEMVEKWKALMGAAVEKGATPRAYSMRDTFETGDLVQHRKFGDGVVDSLVGDDKIMVCFVEGDRLLIHGRGPAR